MTVAEFCYVTHLFFFQTIKNNCMTSSFIIYQDFDDVKFHYITRTKDFIKGGQLGSANLKIMHHRENLEIWDF